MHKPFAIFLVVFGLSIGLEAPAGEPVTPASSSQEVIRRVPRNALTVDLTVLPTGQLAVVWWDRVPGDDDALFQIVEPDGTQVLQATFAANGSWPSIGSDANGNIVVTFHLRTIPLSEIRAVVRDASGSTLVPPFSISEDVELNNPSNLAVRADGSFLVGWQVVRSDSPLISEALVRLVASDGTPVTATIQLDPTWSVSSWPELDTSPTGFVAAWRGAMQDGDPLSIRTARISTAGITGAASTVVTANGFLLGAFDVADLGGGFYAVVWSEGDSAGRGVVRGAIVDASGKVGSTFDVSTETAGVGTVEAVGRPNGDLVVAWTTDDRISTPWLFRDDFETGTTDFWKPTVDPFWVATRRFDIDGLPVGPVERLSYWIGTDDLALASGAEGWAGTWLVDTFPEELLALRWIADAPSP